MPWDSYAKSGIADSFGVKPRTRPLFQFDPGWLFTLAGLAVCAVGVLLPAQSDLEALQGQLQQLRSEENRAYARLKAHADFMDQVDRADPALVRRLAAAQLNMVPEGDTPVLLAASTSSPVTSWIENTIDLDIRPSKPAPVSTLGRWANGPNRLWFFGAGIMAVFVGLILSPSPVRANRAVATSEEPHATSAEIDQDLELPMSQIDDGFELEHTSRVEDAVTEDEASRENEIIVDGFESEAGLAHEDVAVDNLAEAGQNSATGSIVELPPAPWDADVAAGPDVNDHINDLISTIQDCDTYPTSDERLDAPVVMISVEGAGEKPALNRVAREAAD